MKMKKLVLVILLVLTPELVIAFYADFGLEPYDATSIPTNSSIVFQRTLLNLGGAFDEKRGIFITPVSGLYIFILDIVGTHWRDTEDIFHTEAGIFVNGDWKAVITVLFDETDSCFALVHLSQGDKVYCQYIYGVAYLWGSPLTSFSGVLLSPD